MKKIILFLFTILMTSSLWSQEKVQADFHKSTEANDWGFSITPYGLLASMSTDVGGESVRQSFNDLASVTNAGFQVISTLRYKKFSLTFDGTFATLGINENSTALKVDVEIKQNIFDFKLGYNVYENFEYEEVNLLRGWSIGVNAGAKYWKNDVFINSYLQFDSESFPDPIPLIDQFIKQSWWDLMVGIHMKFVVSPKFLLTVGMDVGGFGIGDSSKFSYNFTYINTFKVHKNIAINAGFRSFRYKRLDGEGTEEIQTKVGVLGPLLGVTFGI